MAAPDPLYELLRELLDEGNDPTLLVIDENVDAAQLPQAAAGRRVRYLTNRIDLGRALSASGGNVTCNDFDADAFPDGAFDTIGYRISKEKALVHHIINASARLLAPGGRLVLIGHKNEGLNTYAAKAAERLGGDHSRRRGRGGVTACSIHRGSRPGARLADDDYRDLRPTVAIGDITLCSKPGIYGWQKVDRGSALLIECLAQWLLDAPRLPPSPQVLDLGCGYGYLSVMASGLMEARFVATDNNLAAVAACRQNFSLCAVPGRVVADDCAQQVPEQFDLVLCNPPFHQGFATSHDITGSFLAAAATHLTHSGAALFVVNQFIGLEAKARDYFRRAEELRRRDGFKVVLLRR